MASMSPVQGMPGVEQSQSLSGLQFRDRQGYLVKNIFSTLHVISTSYSILIEVFYRESTGNTDFLL